MLLIFLHPVVSINFLIKQKFDVLSILLNDSETSVPDITDILINGLEQITIPENEVEDILKILDTSKAIGAVLLISRHQ
jgi:hypothetical protein